MRNIRKGAALGVARRARPLTNPHPRDASGASYARVKFKLRTVSALYFLLRLRRMKFQRKTKLQILRRNSTLKAPVLLQNLGEGIDEMSEFRIVRTRV